MRKKRAITLLLLSQLLAFSAKSQTKDDPVNIQSPNVATLGLFGQYPVSLYTGTPQIEVPMCTLTDKDISLPISLSYHASGVRPDMHPGWVGLNWNLNAGGVISRTVQGRRADEYNNPNLDNGTQAGYYYLTNLLNTSSWNTIPYMKSVEEQNWRLPTDQPSKNLDTEPDEFDFSFLNYSGKFFLNSDGTWKVKCDKPVKVVFNNQFLNVPFAGATDTNPGGGNFPSFSGFTIITEDGTQYVFGGNTNAIEYSIPFFNQRDQWTANSWYLTQIISPNNVTTATFTYEPDDWIDQMYSIIHAYYYYQTDTDPVLADQNTCDGGSYNINGYSYTGVLIRPVYLKSIQTSNYTCVFNRSTSTELGYQQWIYDYAELALDGTNDYQTLPFLEYNNPWGYTTMPSSDPYPGCLSKLKWKELNQIVINKTDGTLIKGFNFSYNNNTYERLMLRSLTEFGSDMSTKPPYLFNYIQPATQAQALPPYLAEENDHYGFYNGQFDNIYFNGPNYIYYDGPNNDIANIQQYYNYRQPNFTFMQIGTLNKIVYPTGATTEFTYEANDYSKQVNLIRSSGYTNLGTNNVGGGLRIKKISSYDPSFPNSKVDKQYFYVSNYNNSYTPGNTNYPSSGVLGEHIQYDFTYPEATSKSTATYYQSLFSTESVLPGSSNSEGSPVGYSEVVEKLNDGSYTKYFFTNFDNGYLDEPTVNIQSIQTAYDPYTSNEEERGKQSKIEVHNSSDVLIKSNVFSYTALNKATDYVPALHGRSFFTCGAPVYLDEGDAYKIYTYSYLLSQNIETVFDSNGANPVATTKNYYYDNSVHKQVTRSEIIDSKKQSQMVVFNYPGDMVNLGQTTPYQDMVNRNIVNPVIQQIVKVNGVTQNTFTTQFTEDPVTNLILPSTFQTQAQANPAETRSNFLNYDPNGNLLSFSNDNKPAINYVWSFYGHYPIAKIENADYATVAAVLGGVSTVNAFTNSSPTSASITSFLAPLRTDNRLQNAFITSYNYSPDVGMTSSTDSEGKTQSYEYDNFQRLQNIKDPNGSIITHYKYHFSGVPVTTPVIYKNLSKSGLFYGDCGNPPTTTIQSRPVIYTVPEGTYTSTVSQADADLQAQNDVNLNGQNYANTTHTCW